jgi:hypothetical protein
MGDMAQVAARWLLTETSTAGPRIVRRSDCSAPSIARSQKQASGGDRPTTPRCDHTGPLPSCDRDLYAYGIVTETIRDRRGHEEQETDVSEGSEGTTFMQWRERAQSEVREDGPRVRMMLITAAVVVVVGILVGVIVLMLS